MSEEVPRGLFLTVLLDRNLPLHPPLVVREGPPTPTAAALPATPEVSTAAVVDVCLANPARMALEAVARLGFLLLLLRW